VYLRREHPIRMSTNSVKVIPGERNEINRYATVRCTYIHIELYPLTPLTFSLGIWLGLNCVSKTLRATKFPARPWFLAVARSTSDPYRRVEIVRFRPTARRLFGGNAIRFEKTNGRRIRLSARSVADDERAACSIRAFSLLRAALL
jgi:hypothetical protein